MAQLAEPFKRPGDTTWTIRWREPETGKQRSRNGFKTKPAAREFRDQQLKYVGKTFTSITLNEAADRFLASYPWRSETTKKSMRFKLARWRQPFGNEPVDQLTTDRLQGFRTELGASAWDATQGIKQCLRWCSETGLIGRNPAATLRNPQPQRGEAHPFHSWADVEKVADHVELYGDLIRFAALTGLRPQEWAALEWRDVSGLDGPEPLLTVSRKVGDDGIVRPPKNGKPRTLTLVEPAAQILRDALAGEHHPKYVFPGLRGGRLNTRNWRRRVWNPAVEAAGFPDATPYDLRHTAATWWLRAGLPTWTVAQRLGSSTAMVENAYGHHASDAHAWEKQLLERSPFLDVPDTFPDDPRRGGQVSRKP